MSTSIQPYSPEELEALGRAHPAGAYHGYTDEPCGRMRPCPTARLLATVEAVREEAWLKGVADEREHTPLLQTQIRDLTLTVEAKDAEIAKLKAMFREDSTILESLRGQLRQQTERARCADVQATGMAKIADRHVEEAKKLQTENAALKAQVEAITNGEAGMTQKEQAYADALHKIVRTAKSIRPLLAFEDFNAARDFVDAISEAERLLQHYGDRPKIKV